MNFSGSHHGLSHEADDDPTVANNLAAADNWYAGEFAYLLDKLAGLDEGGKSVLDNSAVLWANEQANGDRHTFDRIPWVIAGSAGGKFKTGRLVKLNHASHADTMLSIIHAMGFESEKNFGHADVSTGPLVGLS